MSELKGTGSRCGSGRRCTKIIWKLLQHYGFNSNKGFCLQSCDHPRYGCWLMDYKLLWILNPFTTGKKGLKMPALISNFSSGYKRLWSIFVTFLNIYKKQFVYCYVAWPDVFIHSSRSWCPHVSGYFWKRFFSLDFKKYPSTGSAVELFFDHP